MTGDPTAATELTTSADAIEDVIAGLQDASAYPNEVLALMPVGTVIQAPSGAIVHGNPAAARILQLSMEQLMGRTSTDPSWRSIHPDGSPFPGEDHPAMVTLRTGEVVEAHMGVRTGDGPATWIHITSLPIRSAAGSLLGTQTFFVDVTGEFHEQQRLRDRIARAERLAAESSDLVVLCDASGVVTETAGSGPWWRGPDRADLIGRPLADGLDAPDPVGRALEDCLTLPGGQARVVIPLPTAASGTRHVEVRLRNRLEDPSLGSVVATISDVEERVLAEEELRVVNLDLERRLDELDRTHRLDGLLAQSSGLLGGCRHVDEVADVLWDLFAQVFPGSEIAVRLDQGSGQSLDVIRSSFADEERIAPDACWAVRTRQVHSEATGGVECDHRLPDGRSVCIPVLVEGQAVGSVNVAEESWPLDSLLATGERIATRLGQAIPPPAVRPRDLRA